MPDAHVRETVIDQIARGRALVERLPATDAALLRRSLDALDFELKAEHYETLSRAILSAESMLQKFQLRALKTEMEEARKRGGDNSGKQRAEDARDLHEEILREARALLKQGKHRGQLASILARNHADERGWSERNVREVLKKKLPR